MSNDPKTLAAQIGEMASAGMAVPVDPDDAAMMAAFEEIALSPEDALASRFDHIAVGDE